MKNVLDLYKHTATLFDDILMTSMSPGTKQKEVQMSF